MAETQPARGSQHCSMVLSTTIWAWDYQISLAFLDDTSPQKWLTGKMTEGIRMPLSTCQRWDRRGQQCAHVCMRVTVCISVCMRECVSIRMFLSTCQLWDKRGQQCAHVWVRVCMCVRMYVSQWMRAWVWRRGGGGRAREDVCVGVWMCMCLCATAPAQKHSELW